MVRSVEVWMDGEECMVRSVEVWMDGEECGSVDGW